MKYKTFTIVTLILLVVVIAMNIVPKYRIVRDDRTVPVENIEEIDDANLDKETPTTLSSDSTISDDSTMTVKIGKGGSVQGVVVMPTNVTDSRCAKEVQCIWAGEVKVQANIVVGSTTSSMEFTLGKPPSVVGEKSIALVEVRPSNSSETKLKPSDYTFVFEVK